MAGDCVTLEYRLRWPTIAWLVLTTTWRSIKVRPRVAFLPIWAYCCAAVLWRFYRRGDHG